MISIHVPLAGDDGSHSQADRHHQISIHVPLAGDDPCAWRSTPTRCRFLSTSPLRGTTIHPYSMMPLEFISIHVPLAGDDGKSCWQEWQDWIISIHVPLAGDDTDKEALP